VSVQNKFCCSYCKIWYSIYALGFGKTKCHFIYKVIIHRILYVLNHGIRVVKISETEDIKSAR